MKLLPISEREIRRKLNDDFLIDAYLNHVNLEIEAVWGVEGARYAPVIHQAAWLCMERTLAFMYDQKNIGSHGCVELGAYEATYFVRGFKMILGGFTNNDRWDFSSQCRAKSVFISSLSKSTASEALSLALLLANGCGLLTASPEEIARRMNTFGFSGEVLVVLAGMSEAGSRPTIATEENGTEIKLDYHRDYCHSYLAQAGAFGGDEYRSVDHVLHEAETPTDMILASLYLQAMYDQEALLKLKACLDIQEHDGYAPIELKPMKAAMNAAYWKTVKDGISPDARSLMMVSDKMNRKLFGEFEQRILGAIGMRAVQEGAGAQVSQETRVVRSMRGPI